MLCKRVCYVHLLQAPIIYAYCIHVAYMHNIRVYHKQYTLCNICNVGVKGYHDPKHTLMFCEDCNQYVSSNQHVHYNTPREVTCEKHGIYCVSCKKCSPAGNKTCTYCNNVVTGVRCGNNSTHEPAYVCKRIYGWSHINKLFD